MVLSFWSYAHFARLTALSLTLWTSAHATTAEGPWVLAVSKPPAPLLPSDPPQGRLYRAPTSLAYAEPMFQIESGPRDLGYVVLDAGAGLLTFDGGGDPAAPGGVMVVDALTARVGGRFDPTRDTVLTGDAVGLGEPKDLLVVPEEGAIVVADFGRAELRVFGREATGDTAPRFVVDDLGLTDGGDPRRPWGLTYDAAADRLFVGATDGVVVVFEAFFGGEGGAPDRFITPTLGGEKASANLHDLVILPDEDLLIVLDVGEATTPGEPGWDGDGMILVLGGVSTADGEVPLRLRVRGPASLLGNPVGLAWAAPSLFVAESARDLVLRFDGLLEERGDHDLPPDAAVTVVRPESVRVVEAARSRSSSE